MGSQDVTELSQVSDELLCKYIHSCHILHYHDLVDAYGHISVRLSPSTFLMCRYQAPALCASKKDLVVYKVEDGQPVAPDAPRGLPCAPVCRMKLKDTRVLGALHPFGNLQGLPQHTISLAFALLRCGAILNIISTTPGMFPSGRFSW